MLLLSNILTVLSAVVTCALVYLVMIRRTVQPVTALTESMRLLADGDTSVNIPQTRFRDEVGGNCNERYGQRQIHK